MVGFLRIGPPRREREAMGKTRTKTVKGGLSISAGTLLTRILGFAREILSGAYFGTSRHFDAFVIAYSVPGLFRRVLGEEMFERAFLPHFRRLVSEGAESTARAFLIRIFLITCLALSGITLLILAVLPWLLRILAPGFDAAQTADALHLARLMLPFLIIIGVSAFFGSLLQFSRKMLLFSAAPALTNIIVILSLIALHRPLGVRSLIIGWLAGAAGAVLIQAPVAIRIISAMPARGPGKKAPPVKPALHQGGQVLSSSVVTKSVEVVDRLVASLVGSGAISSLYFAFRLVHLPFSVLSLALSRSIAPELSRLRGRRDSEGFRNLISFGFSINLLLLSPVIVTLMILSHPVVSVIYGRGAFGGASVDATSLALLFYAPAILGTGLIALMNRVFASLEDNRVPLLAALIGGSINIALDLLLYRTSLRQGGIALASSISLAVQAGIMMWLIRRYSVSLEWRRLAGILLRSTPGLLLLGFLSAAGRYQWNWGHGFLRDLTGLLLIVSAGFLGYFILSAVFWKRENPKKVRLLLTGGGTGGHVYPALAIRSILDQRGLISDSLYLGVRGRAEEQLVPRQGIPLATISSAPISGGSPLAMARSLPALVKGFFQSIFHLLAFRPHLVVATGGYVSAPVVAAAFVLKPFLKLSIVIEEQNITPGLLNKAASLMAGIVLVAFRETAFFVWSNRCVHAGYPVRPEFSEPRASRKELRHRLGLKEDDFVVLVTGGSMGARSLNRAIAAALPALDRLHNLTVVHAIGLMDTPEYHGLKDTMERLSISSGTNFQEEELKVRASDGHLLYRGFPYLHDMVDYLQAADLVVCRAGAGAIAEIMALGKAALLVPKRGLPGDHQELNAVGIAEMGAAEVLFEKRDPSGVDIVNQEELAGQIVRLAEDEDTRKRMGDSAGALFVRDFSERVTDAIQAVLSGENPDFATVGSRPKLVQFQGQFDQLIAHLDRRPAGSLYHRLYSIKLDEYLGASAPLVINKGIKLIGSLKRTDRYPFLFDGFHGFSGFLRRNTLSALRKADSFDSRFAELIPEGLSDSYFEVRREAIALYNRFYEEVNKLPVGRDIQEEILRHLGSRVERFEVKAQAIQATVRFVPELEVYPLLSRFLTARNIRLREAVLQGIAFGLSHKLLTQRTAAGRFIRQMLITTSLFTPEFHLRQRYMQVVKKLDSGETGEQT